MTDQDRSHIHPDAAGAQNADAAPARSPEPRDSDPNASPFRPAEDRVAAHEKPDQLKHDAASREEALVDEGLEETFPASDPATGKHIT
ncbi:hypothetical protein [Brevundimonas balnearis]|uniref:Uncharacterized protein n=1 Tax=Brevundimonas balnearis TaxID=1572858 RepID=A0ABV6R3M0_9CAUL